jgi:hypothetical protein
VKTTCAESLVLTSHTAIPISGFNSSGVRVVVANLSHFRIFLTSSLKPCLLEAWMISQQKRSRFLHAI